MFYRLDESGSVKDFSESKYADDCLYTELEIVMSKKDKRFYVKGTEPLEAQIETEALKEAKQERFYAVRNITVEVDGMVFDGDEESQTRMGRTIASAVALGIDLKNEKRTWVLANNQIAEVTLMQLAKALRLAGEAQTALWTVPYETQNMTNKSMKGKKE